MQLRRQLIQSKGLHNRPKRPNYSVIQYVVGYEGPASNAHYPKTTEKYFKQMYFEALDAVFNAMEDHFEQPALKKIMNVEQLFLKTTIKMLLLS